jgi:hypothetical protein
MDSWSTNVVRVVLSSPRPFYLLPLSKCLDVPIGQHTQLATPFNRKENEPTEVYVDSAIQWPRRSLLSLIGHLVRAFGCTRVCCLRPAARLRNGMGRQRSNCSDFAGFAFMSQCYPSALLPLPRRVVSHRCCESPLGSHLGRQGLQVHLSCLGFSSSPAHWLN